MTSNSNKKVRIRHRRKRRYFTSLEFKWAAIISLFYLLWVILEFELGLEDSNVDNILWATGLVEIPIFLLYLLAIGEKKKEYFKGKMKFKHGFNTGFAITVFTTLLAPLNQLIIHKVVFPNFFQEAIQYFITNDNMSEEKAHSVFNLTTFMGASMVNAFIFGLIFSVIAALILKNRRG